MENCPISQKRLRRSFPDAITVRCFAFEPSEEQAMLDMKGMPSLMLFPPGLPPPLAHPLESTCARVIAAVATRPPHVRCGEPCRARRGSGICHMLRRWPVT